jgi:N-acetylglutamate synthase-like GNAT family acetyltransferase
VVAKDETFDKFTLLEDGGKTITRVALHRVFYDSSTEHPRKFD